MVREGYAWALVKYSTSYVQGEAEARALHIGIGQGKAEPAWEFREYRWAGAEVYALKGCAIKGNVTAHGRTYHMPVEPLVRQDPDRRGEGQALLLLGGRGAGRRLAPGRRSLTKHLQYNDKARRFFGFTVPEGRPASLPLAFEG